MRYELSQVKGHKTFYATVARISPKKGERRHLMLLLIDVKDQHGKFITDHIWMPHGEVFNGIKTGHVIKFKAKVRSYTKPVKSKVIDGVKLTHKVCDYALTQPKQVKVVGFSLAVFDQK